MALLGDARQFQIVLHTLFAVDTLGPVRPHKNANAQPRGLH
jgi:hypothetical protein